MFNLSSLPELTPEDLLTYQEAIKEELQKIIPAQKFTLFFPAARPDYLSKQDIFIEKNKIHLAINYSQKFLGVITLHNYTKRRVRGLKTALPTILQLILQHISIYKKFFFNEQLHIYTSNYIDFFLQETIRDILLGLNPKENNFSSNYFSVSLLAINPLLKEYPLKTQKFLLQEIIGLVQTNFSPWPLALLSGQKLCLLLTNLNSAKGSSLLTHLWSKLHQHNFSHPVLKNKLKLDFGVSLVTFPKDFDSQELLLNNTEIIPLFKEKLDLALEKSLQFKEPFSFDKILKLGGRIKEVNCEEIIIDIGKESKVQDGYIFTVLNKDKINPKEKGKIIIKEVGQKQSKAKVIVNLEPIYKIKKGDRLKLTSQSDSKFYLDYKNTILEEAKKILESYGQVKLALFQVKSEKISHKDSLDLLEEEIKKITSPLFITSNETQIIAALYQESNEELKEKLLKLEQEFYKQHQITFYVGVGHLPLPPFHLSDLYRNAEKALIHSRYYEERPHLAFFDSISLTISGDRMFSLGNYFDALSEYQKALYLDAKNILALNSLGISYAKTGNLPRAKETFLEVLKIEPGNELARYNLGRILEQLGQEKEAELVFLQCKTPLYRGFSLLRLGKKAEKQKDFKKARDYYLQAKELLPNYSQPHTLLASLYLKKEKVEKAKEELHQALLKNSLDALALNLLATIYLKNKENLSLAESLAQKSISLKPEIPEFWKTLKEILAAQHKEKELAFLVN